MIGGIHFEAPEGITVQMSPEVVEHFNQNRQQSCFRREAGGQLFARVRGKRWMIEVATGPRKSDWRSRFGYRPDRAAERREIDAKFAEGLHFVGDWHTHPQKTPRASALDIESMEETVVRSTHNLPGFLMCIVGTRSFPEGLWVSFHTGKATHAILHPSLIRGA